MNCCNNYGQCTGANGCPARARRFPFAPGVIEGPSRRWLTPRRALALARALLVLALLVLALLAALSATLGFAAGYFTMPTLGGVL